MNKERAANNFVCKSDLTISFSFLPFNSSFEMLPFCSIISLFMYFFTNFPLFQLIFFLSTIFPSFFLFFLVSLQLPISLPILIFSSSFHFPLSINHHAFSFSSQYALSLNLFYFSFFQSISFSLLYFSFLNFLSHSPFPSFSLSCNLDFFPLCQTLFKLLCFLSHSFTPPSFFSPFSFLTFSPRINPLTEILQLFFLFLDFSLFLIHFLIKCIHALTPLPSSSLRTNPSLIYSLLLLS
ncbi:unnamed protein product [Acanthosepion pharaonis]|uniref:Uncharacterized protein n=1 Tax=Acanthosepion pharaonis TaxID=158019 RepID=A0A812E7T2_ACAPH|nr:unnamed protein product [Sepia pharaonis]